ncbi:MAG TPA: hypothetical protein VGH28_24955 [Polyangiaceae bacterium]|jgi:hypothetical protein
MKTTTVFALAAACALACEPWARAPEDPARVVSAADGVDVTLPHWFEAHFPGPVRDSTVALSTGQGDLPFRTFVSNLPTGTARVQVTQGPNGWSQPKERVLLDMIKATRSDKQLLAGKTIDDRGYVGADMKLRVAPRSADNPSDYTLDCRVRQFVDETKMVNGVFCYDAARPDPAFERAADSFRALD